MGYLLAVPTGSLTSEGEYMANEFCKKHYISGVAPATKPELQAEHQFQFSPNIKMFTLVTFF